MNDEMTIMIALEKADNHIQFSVSFLPEMSLTMIIRIDTNDIDNASDVLRNAVSRQLWTKLSKAVQVAIKEVGGDENV